MTLNLVAIALLKMRAVMLVDVAGPLAPTLDGRLIASSIVWMCEPCQTSAIVVSLVAAPIQLSDKGSNRAFSFEPLMLSSGSNAMLFWTAATTVPSLGALLATSLSARMLEAPGMF